MHNERPLIYPRDKSTYIIRTDEYGNEIQVEQKTTVPFKGAEYVAEECSWFKTGKTGFDLDPIYQKVVAKLEGQFNKGMAAHNISIGEARAPTVEWLRNFQEELLDGAIYVEKIMTQMDDLTEVIEAQANELKNLRTILKKVGWYRARVQ